MRKKIRAQNFSEMLEEQLYMSVNKLNFIFGNVWVCENNVQEKNHVCHDIFESAFTEKLNLLYPF